MASGPARKPTAQLVATGSTLAPGRAAAEVSSLAQVGAPDMPANLDSGARAEWSRLLPLLLARKVMTSADSAVLAEHCQAVSDAERYERLLRAAGTAVVEVNGEPVEVILGEVVTTPNGALQRHPYTVLLREARVRKIKTASLLGLSPADRSRATQAKDEGPAKNAFNLLPGGKATG